MCTVTFMPRRTGYCLAMNRDERRARAKGQPPAIRQINGSQVLYPSEPTGGTWIALKDKGVAFALINWYSANAKAEGTAVSRGVIIPRLCSAESVALANTEIVSLPLTRINPFRLIGIFPASEEIIEWSWDMTQLTQQRFSWSPRQWISSGFDETAAQKIRSRTFRRAQRQKSAGTINWLRRLHCSHSPLIGPFSTCMHREDAATVSYTEIRFIHNQARMLHVAGAPCGRESDRCVGQNSTKLQERRDVTLPVRDGHDLGDEQFCSAAHAPVPQSI